MISIGFDPIAFLVSLYAVWFTYRESKRNNTIVVKVIRCGFSERQSREENRGQLVGEFSILIRNQGISLHDPGLVLQFHALSGWGQLYIPLKRRSERAGEHSEFARGMIAEFSLRSHELDQTSEQFLFSLNEPAAQNIRLNLSSQGYLAKSFRVAGPWDRFAARWNAFAYRINRLFDRNVRLTPESIPNRKLGRVLPMLNTLQMPLLAFISSIKERKEATASANVQGG